MRDTATAQIDLRGRPHEEASDLYARVRELTPGQGIELVSDEDPQLLLHSLRLHVHGRIAWEHMAAGPPVWRVRILPRRDLAPRTAGELLSRDHERLDLLLGDSLQAANAGDTATVQRLFPAFAEGLRRHIRVEDELLAPAIRNADAGDDDPVTTMLREHEDIQAQLELIEDMLADASASELATYLALLSGTLAKHEVREEERVFPAWDAVLRQAGAEHAHEMLKQVQAILAPENPPAP